MLTHYFHKIKVTESFNQTNEIKGSNNIYIICCNMHVLNNAYNFWIILKVIYKQ